MQNSRGPYAHHCAANRRPGIVGVLRQLNCEEMAVEATHPTSETKHELAADPFLRSAIALVDAAVGPDSLSTPPPFIRLE
jgi:hypothetical protein